ncbi:helix-turn-helix domain-containing protein [Nostoc sp.]|uniref:helix-turn-helix domain-containing protein n=1 Tax=Nostoc sp. TaxID=1180 RepID=UPI002FFD36F1
MVFEGETDATITDRLRVSVSTVERTRSKFIKSGIEGTLNDRPHPPKLRKLDCFKEAFLIATASYDQKRLMIQAPKFIYGDY